MADASFILSIISLVLLMIGVLFTIIKLVHKFTKKEAEETFYGKINKPFYQMHKATPTIATILWIIHMFLDLQTASLADTITGWIFGGTMLSMTIIGIVLGFKSNWIPYNNEQDRQFLVPRILKWILTIAMFASLICYYIL